MDPNANAGHPEPGEAAAARHRRGRADRPGDRPARPRRRGAPRSRGGSGRTWCRSIITAVVVALVIIYLDPIDTLKVVIGLGLVIFIHELGHFLAAKWCDVHVKTFSIGFGPAVPFCSYKWGETTYMVGIIPLGGYVAMVGEGENAADEEAEDDPRELQEQDASASACSSSRPASS